MTKERIHYLSNHLSTSDGSILCFLLGWYRKRPKSEFWTALEAAIPLYRPDLKTPTSDQGGQPNA